MLETFMLSASSTGAAKLFALSFFVGGCGGFLAGVFVGALHLILIGAGSLELGLLMLVMMLGFLCAFQKGEMFASRKHYYDPKHYERHPPSRWFDPNLDYEANRPLDEFRDKPELKTQYLDYNPKDTAERYRNN